MLKFVHSVKKYLENFEKRCWRKMKIIWTDLVKNEEILEIQGGKERNMYLG